MENFPVVCLVIIYGLCLSVGLVEKFLFFSWGEEKDSEKVSAL